VEKTTCLGAQLFLFLTKYYAGDQIKKNKMGGESSTYGGGEKCIQEFGRKPDRKRPLGRTRRRWEDNIKINLQEVEQGT